MKPMLYRHLTGIILLIIFIVIGCFNAQDYGASWDDVVQREMGKTSYDYVFNGDTKLHHYLEKDHGVGFELPLYFLEKKFKQSDTHAIYITRHLITHLFFLLGAFVFYLMCSKLFNSRTLGIIAFLALVCHPRLYAQSFFNSKDIPFLVAHIFSLYACMRAFKKQDTVSYLLLGVCIGYATSIRMMSLVFIAIILGFLFIDIFRAKQQKKSMLVALTNPLVFVASAAVTLTICWPVLWTSPLHNFVDAYQSMSKFRWINGILFDGQNILSTNMHWYYLPKYLLITTPMLWSITIVIGMIMILATALRRPLTYIADTNKRVYITNTLIPIGTILAIVVFDSIVYDGWRHVYFIYPSLLIVAMALLHGILQKMRIKALLIGVCAVQIIATMVYMVRNHPYQMTYFNSLVSHKEGALRANYEMDYWGVATKQAYEYLLEQDTSSQIKVYNFLSPIENNWLILPKKDRARIQLLDCADGAEYFITSYRAHPQDFKYPHKIYEIKVQGSNILAIYKMYDPTRFAEKNCKTVWE